MLQRVASIFAFCIFFLGFLSNAIIITVLPDEILRSYVNAYTLVGACGALSFFMLYSSNVSWPRIRWVGTALLGSYAIAAVLADWFWVSVVYYPLILIFNDYVTTQNETGTGRSLYRVLLVVSVIPFLTSQWSFEVIFQARMVLLLAIAAAYLLNTANIVALRVRSTRRYIVFNYVFYYGPLFLIANLPLGTDSIKMWYVFTQAGLVLYLKYLDYMLRNAYTATNQLGNLIVIATVCVPFVPMSLDPNVLGPVIYFVGLLGLVHSKRYIEVAPASAQS